MAELYQDGPDRRRGGRDGGNNNNNNNRKRTQQTDPAEYTPRRKLLGQRPVDYFCSMINYLQQRPYVRHQHYFDHHVPPHPYHCKDLVPPKYTCFNPSTALCTQWVHTAFHVENKMAPGGRMAASRRVNYTALVYSPTGRRVLAATSNREFFLYNGNAFGVEMRTIAHDDIIRSLAWGNVNDIVLSSDEGGVVKMWLSNFNNIAQFNTQQRAVRELCWSPGEQKLCTGGQDGSARIWDTERVASSSSGGAEFERKLEGHGGDVHTVHWHPTKSLLVTGSQDRDARLWDPRASNLGGGLVATMTGHTQPLTKVRWNHSGTLVATASKDSTMKVWDLRNASEAMATFVHTKDILSMEWHPFSDGLVATGTADGLIAFWVVQKNDGTLRPDGSYEVRRWAAAIPNAHEDYRGTPQAVLDLKWSAMGHVLASCSADVKFWTRNKPGAQEEVRNVESADIVLQQQAPPVPSLPQSLQSSGVPPPSGPLTNTSKIMSILSDVR